MATLAAKIDLLNNGLLPAGRFSARQAQILTRIVLSFERSTEALRACLAQGA